MAIFCCCLPSMPPQTSMILPSTVAFGFSVNFLCLSGVSSRIWEMLHCMSAVKIASKKKKFFFCVTSFFGKWIFHVARARTHEAPMLTTNDCSHLNRIFYVHKKLDIFFLFFCLREYLLLLYLFRVQDGGDYYFRARSKCQTPAKL